VAIDARAAVRREIGGVERLAHEMIIRLPRVNPGRYRVVRPAVKQKPPRNNHMSVLQEYERLKISFAARIVSYWCRNCRYWGRFSSACPMARAKLSFAIL
jgi:hypothetical protein